MVPSKRTPETAAGCSVLQHPQPSKLRTSKHGVGWCSGKTLYPNWFRGADVHHVAADWTTRSRSGRRQQPSDDRLATADGILGHAQYRNLAKHSVSPLMRTEVRGVMIDQYSCPSCSA